jgi:hypothetical protein
MVPAAVVAERLGRDKSLVLRWARRDRVGVRMPLHTDGGVQAAMFVPRPWARGIAERCARGLENALGAAK